MKKSTKKGNILFLFLFGLGWICWAGEILI